MEQLTFDDLETWKPVVGYEGFYEVSDHGRIKSLPRKTANGCLGRVLKPCVTRSGHLMVALSVDRQRKSFLVHRLIALAFLGPQPPGHEVCHNDGNPANNVLGNLRWGTRGENIYDSVRHGTNYWASRTYCSNDHEYTPENTRVVRRPAGKFARICLKCRQATVQKSDKRRRAGGNAAA